MYKTKTFEPGDLGRFNLSFDFNVTPGVGQVWGFKPYVHTDGSFHAYGSVHYGHFKTEVVHFVPAKGEVWTEERPIQKWRVSKILVNEKERGDKLAYDGFCIRDEEQTLYLGAYS